jgi:hypothetical protein
MTPTDPCACVPIEPEMAARFFANLPIESWVSDDSHFIVSVRRCRCGKRYLQVFYELIDWSGGDDSQARTIFALGFGESTSWERNDPAVEQSIRSLPARRQLVWSRARGDASGPPWWMTGPILWLPHD